MLLSNDKSNSIHDKSIILEIKSFSLFLLDNSVSSSVLFVLNVIFVYRGWDEVSSVFLKCV